MADRHARGGTLVLGGGFAGSYVARLPGGRGAPIVSPDNFMLFTPLLPEAASGTIEPRHVVVPLRQMCPHADLLLGRAMAHDAEAQTVTVETKEGALSVGYTDLVVALGAVARTLPISGLAEHGLGFKDLPEAIHLRNHVLRRLEDAAVATEDAAKRRHLTFVFVGAGYAGVEALAELADLVDDALRYYDALQGIRPRWVLVDAAPKILPQLPQRLGEYAMRELTGRGIDIRLSTRLARATATEVELSDGETIPTGTLVWTAGVKPNPLLGELGLPLDEQGRVRVDPFLRVEGTEHVWSLGDGARVQNAATPERPDPPTSQHALRQAPPAPRPPPAPPPRAHPRRPPRAVPLPHARTSGDARPQQGRRRRPGRDQAARLPRLVRHAHLPPVPAAAAVPEAARRHRLDGRPPLPPRQRRARPPRPPGAPRWLKTSAASSPATATCRSGSPTGSCPPTSPRGSSTLRSRTCGTATTSGSRIPPRPRAS